MSRVFSERRKRFLQLLEGRKSAGAALSSPANVRYLSGFTGSNGLLLAGPTGATLFTDPRYTIQAQTECDCTVRVVKGDLWDAAAKAWRARGPLALENAHLSHRNWLKAKHLFAGVPLRDASGLAERLRAVKDEGEIALIRASVLLNSKAYQQTLKRVKPDWTELEVAAELDHAMRKLGAEGCAFETIVASGEHAALPHARPRPVPVGSNRLLLIDMGASLNGYASDMTRVVHLGPPTEKARRLYDAVLEAQLAAVEAVRPGARGEEVDAAARKRLDKRGFGKLFTHSTGHGLGLEIHEDPKIGRLTETVLEPGMVITIEPGVYDEGFGGVRIEDTVLVTPTGCEVLTPTKKELQSIL